MGHFSRVISIFIEMYENKSSNTQAENRLESLLGLINSNLMFRSEYELAELLEKSARNLIEYDAMVFVYFKSNEKRFEAIKVVNKTQLKYIKEGTIIDLDNTILGKSIRTKSIIKIDDTGQNAIARYSNDEEVGLDGSFISLPLFYEDEIYGMVCFENIKKSYFNNNDLKVLKHAVKLFSFIVYSYSYQSVLKDLLTLEPGTKVLIKSEFLSRVDQMMSLSKSFNANSSLALVHIDRLNEENTIFDTNSYPKIEKLIIALIKERSDFNFLVGRIDERIFGVFIVNCTTNQAFAWAESIRIKIARVLNDPQIASGNTISVGIANVVNDKTIEKIFNDAELALKKAIEKGGNAIKVL